MKNFETGSNGKKSTRLTQIEKAMKEANTLLEWKELAEDHDLASGASRWKTVDQTRLYDFASIRIRIDKLRALRANHDDHGLLFALNEGVHGNMGGMGKPILYTKAKIGTKKLIEDYVQEISNSLEYIARLDDQKLSRESRLEFFQRASHCYGRTALMLSGGGALGNFHLGVIKVLMEQKLLPVVISGSSAGAFIAAIVGTHTEQELLKMYDDGSLLAAVSMGAGKFKFALKRGELIGINEVEEGIARLVPDMTFQQAYETTGRSINISISPYEPQQRSRLLNAIASPNVLIRSAVMASCAIPGVFPPVTLMARNVHGETQPYLPSRRWIDGSFSQDLPSKRLTRMYGVNHFIVSQVNPHVLPLVTDPATQQGLRGAFSQFMRTMSKESLRGTLGFMHRRMNMSPRAHMTLNSMYALFDQEYTGDINIFPNTRFFDPRKIISAMTAEEIQFFLREGERATWPKISAIETNTRIGRTLDRILIDFERRQSHWLHTGPKTDSFVDSLRESLGGPVCEKESDAIYDKTEIN